MTRCRTPDGRFSRHRYVACADSSEFESHRRCGLCGRESRSVTLKGASRAIRDGAPGVNVAERFNPFWARLA